MSRSPVLPLALPQGPALPFIPSSPQHLPLPSLHGSQAMASPQAGTAGTSSAPNRSLGGSEPMSSLVTQEQGAVVQGHERVPWKACSRRFLAQLQGWGGSTAQHERLSRGVPSVPDQWAPQGPVQTGMGGAWCLQASECILRTQGAPRLAQGLRSTGWAQDPKLCQPGPDRPGPAAASVLCPPLCDVASLVAPIPASFPCGPGPISPGRGGACESTSASVCAAVTYT